VQIYANKGLQTASEIRSRFNSYFTQFSSYFSLKKKEGGEVSLLTPFAKQFVTGADCLAKKSRTA